MFEPNPLVLVSHHLCPYVQRAAISLMEKGIPFERRNIDLSKKPAWFKQISPLGKTPVLLVDGVPIFESVAILEYLEDVLPNPLHPDDPIHRARHRGWIEVGSSVLNDIAKLYSAKDKASFEGAISALSQKFDLVEAEISEGPWFGGDQFSLVDTVFGPIFRYFDVFDQIEDFGILSPRPKLKRWRNALALRPSVRIAVDSEYETLLFEFLLERDSHLSGKIAAGIMPRLVS